MFRLIFPGIRNIASKINRTESDVKASVQQRKPGAKQKEPMEWEKIFPNDIADKELISKRYKQLIHIHTMGF